MDTEQFRARKEALHAAVFSVSPDGDPAALLRHALVFEDYLRGGQVDVPDPLAELDERARHSNFTEGLDTLMTQIPTTAVARIRSVIGAAAGESLLSAVERFAGRVREDAAEEADKALFHARHQLLDQLEHAAHRDDVREWIRQARHAIYESRPITVLPGLTRGQLYGDVMRRIGEASTAVPSVARWLADVKRAMDSSNEPGAAEIPRLEPMTPETFTSELHVYTAHDVTAPEPPDDVAVLLANNSWMLRRLEGWDSTEGKLWKWSSPEGVRGPALLWRDALNHQQMNAFPLRDVTAADLQATENAQRDEVRERYSAPREDYPVPAELIPVAEVTPHDDPTKSAHPDRYELRIASNTEREVLVCLRCVDEMGETAGIGNVIDVVQHDAYHDEQSREGTKP